jgi:tetratricopeptide (TPR) repeat protein
VVAWHIHAARESLADARPDRAIAALRRVEKLPVRHGEVLFLLGRSMRRLDRLDDAVRYFDAAGQAGWPRSELLEQDYLMLMQAGSLRDADPYLREVLRKGCSDELAEEIYEAQCRGFIATYRLNEALRCIDFWLKWHPQARLARLWRGDLWNRTDHQHDAAKEYQGLVERDPEDVEARVRLGDVLLELNDVQGALKQYEACLAIAPENPAALLGLLKCRRRAGELGDEKERLLALLKLDLTRAQRAEALYELGETALYRQEYEEAVKCLSQVREFDPTHRTVSAPLAAAYARLGRQDLAKQAQREGTETQERLRKLADITQRVLDHPDDPDLRYEAGMILMAQGLKTEGAAWLQTAVACNPAHRNSHAALADYFSETGDSAAAEKHRKLAE